MLLFDLWNRTYKYPLEYLIEAMAPTSEHDFDLLPHEKQRIYRYIQGAHIHSSPDGPWFFIIARNNPYEGYFQLVGITDTSMLRPQVFALQEGDVQIGLICSEKQAIDATLRSLSKEDKRICPVADRYWNARGGSHTDGGAFIFDLKKDSFGRMRMQCRDKFGVPVPMPGGDQPCDFSHEISLPSESEEIIQEMINEEIIPENAFKTFKMICELLPGWTFDEFRLACRQITLQAKTATSTAVAIEVLTLLNDRKY